MFGASPADQRLYQLAAQGLLGGQNPTQIGNVYNTSTGQVMRGGQWVDPSQSGQLAGATQAATQAEDQARLEQQRQMAERLLQQWRDFYPNNPAAMQLQGQIQSRASGQQAPFTDQVVAQIVANQASGANAQLQDEQEMIRRRFANSGLGGGGGQLQSELDARRGYNAQVAGFRNDAQIQQQLQNFTAQANAQAQLQQLLAQQAQNLGSGTAATANFMGGYGVSGGGAEANNLLAGFAGGGGYRALGQPNVVAQQQNPQFQAAIQSMLGGLGGGRTVGNVPGQQLSVSGPGVPTNSLGQGLTTRGGVNPRSLSSSSLKKRSGSRGGGRTFSIGGTTGGFLGD